MSIFMNDNDFELLRKIMYTELDLLLERNSTEIFDFKYKNQLIECFIQGLIKSEYEIFMKYADDTNYKNGSNKRKIADTTGYLEISIPRDRNGNFTPSSISKYSRSTDDIITLILTLVKTKMSYQDIANFLQNYSGIVYSKEAISKIGTVIQTDINDFNTRKLDEEYFAIYLDATYMPIRIKYEVDENGVKVVTYQKHAVYFAVAINTKGQQEILEFKIGYNENTTLWDEIVASIRNRGVKKIGISVSDGFVNMDTTVKRYFPETKIQRCTFHLLMNIGGKVPNKKKKKVMSDFAELYKCSSLGSYYALKTKLEEKYIQYLPKLNSSINADNVDSYLMFPACIQRLISTSNRVERVIGNVKSRLGTTKSFTSEESAEKIIGAVCIEINQNSTRCANGFAEYLKYIDEKKDGN